MQIVEAWESLKAQHPPAQETITGSISFALSTNLAFFTSDIIASFSSAFPKINITIQEIFPSQDYEKSLLEDHDLILYTLPKAAFSKEILTTNEAYCQSVLFMDSIVIMVSKNSPYAKYKTLPKKALQEWPWVIYSLEQDSLTTAPVHQLIWQGTTPKHLLCVSNYSALFDSIIYHHYVAVSSSIIKRSFYYRDKKISLLKLPQKIDSYCILAVKTEKAELPYIQSFMRLLKKLFLD